MLSQERTGGRVIGPEVREALRIAHDELGVRAVRAHAILCRVSPAWNWSPEVGQGQRHACLECLERADEMTALLIAAVPDGAGYSRMSERGQDS